MEEQNTKRITVIASINMDLTTKSKPFPPGGRNGFRPGYAAHYNGYGSTSLLHLFIHKAKKSPIGWGSFR